jgi:hypothetical protein
VLRTTFLVPIEEDRSDTNCGSDFCRKRKAGKGSIDLITICSHVYIYEYSKSLKRCVFLMFIVLYKFLRTLEVNACFVKILCRRYTQAAAILNVKACCVLQIHAHVHSHLPNPVLNHQTPSPSFSPSFLRLPSSHSRKLTAKSELGLESSNPSARVTSCARHLSPTILHNDSEMLGCRHTRNEAGESQSLMLAYTRLRDHTC